MSRQNARPVVTHQGSDDSPAEPESRLRIRTQRPKSWSRWLGLGRGRQEGFENVFVILLVAFVLVAACLLFSWRRPELTSLLGCAPLASPHVELQPACRAAVFPPVGKRKQHIHQVQLCLGRKPDLQSAFSTFEPAADGQQMCAQARIRVACQRTFRGKHTSSGTQSCKQRASGRARRQNNITSATGSGTTLYIKTTT